MQEYLWWIKYWHFYSKIANHQSLLFTNISFYTVYSVLQISCAEYVGDNKIWLASDTDNQAQVMVLELAVPNSANDIYSDYTFTIPGASRIVCMAAVTIVQPSSNNKRNRTIWVGSENKR